MKPILKQFLYKNFFWKSEYECCWLDSRTIIFREEDNEIFLFSDPQFYVLIKDIAHFLCKLLTQIFWKNLILMFPIDRLSLSNIGVSFREIEPCLP